ncbi:MAG: hypothetical protein FJZ00_12740 [Candidatus Sericytochromatia bacterium]|uniref:Uncharacterized protein n=1 Tax=Candidatus Tanganyikabacteria bacterium TaxID=2961651 RepID=A0A937X8C5_9BACT|nr:hypothetical protein [Candidatus Tanganyikabacteria bacterium]
MIGRIGKKSGAAGVPGADQVPTIEVADLEAALKTQGSGADGTSRAGQGTTGTVADNIAGGAVAQISEAARRVSREASGNKLPGRPIEEVAREAKREIRYIFELGLAFGDNMIARSAEIANAVSREAAPVVAAANRAAAMAAGSARQSVYDAATEIHNTRARRREDPLRQTTA